MTDLHAYRPSNGTEGEIFMSQWCAKCTLDRGRREGDAFDGCEIIDLTMAYDIDDPSYPDAWVRDDDGTPHCLKFAPEDVSDQPLDPLAVVRPLL
ncbi:hypothetical protein [Sphingobium yanoikuyae]|uniref:hypothetical protein n=1 Tax=Sphingobium yanoikuyae TaxID=13690 RepID=UPI002431DB8D|nr:hypothetical protein [Sphingobium yanoikuyae]